MPHAISHRDELRIVHATPKQNEQSLASLLHNSRSSFLNTCAARPRVKRKVWMTDNRCSRSIVHLKKESNKSVFLPKEPGNTKKGQQTDSHQRDYVTGETRRSTTTQNM
ncbi:hypothetical protein TNCV_740761 [Trichonephila clavipes]|nr:hypothetical protein TNCV_740761 [Trichonephila clavipes]